VQLILWRHAQARDGSPDLARELTDHGRKQARAMAAWLAPRLPAAARLVASPALRSRQTAQALRTPDLIDPRIAPEAGLDKHLAAIGRSIGADTDTDTGAGAGAGADARDRLANPAEALDERRVLVIVGHQPTLGRLASHLLGGQALDWRIRKGAIWWLATRAREGHARFWLRAVIDPDML
jgi:phosphohistidine phosphatase